MFSKICNILCLPFLLSLYLFAGALFYWTLIDNQRPILETEVLYYSEEVNQGGRFFVEWKIHRKRNDCQVHIERFIVNTDNNKRYLLSKSERSTKRDGKIVFVLDFPIPDNYTPGIYYYQTLLTYYCNPSNYLLGPISVEPQRLYFQILEN